jgi:N-acetylglutamate synthase-like GNAT family acetyltransferase
MTDPKRSSDPLYKLLRNEQVAEFNEQREAEKSYDFRGCTFRGSDLRGLDAHGLDMRDAYFRDADLRGVDLRQTQLDGASLGSAKISGAYFPNDIAADEIRFRAQNAPRRMPSADSSLRLEYVREPDVSSSLARELIELISGCFNQPHNAFFRERRYAQEMPLHRYLLRSSSGKLVAHLAAHEKVIGVAGADVAIGGMAEVCVLESERGRGHVRFLLEQAHQGLQERGLEFAFLFGDRHIYASSGYQPVTAPIRHRVTGTERFEARPNPSALVKPLAGRAWPDGPVDLRGPLF